MGKFTKVMKFQLQYIDGAGDFHEMQKLLWEIQRSEREIMNRTIQECYHFDAESMKHKRETGEYLDIKDYTDGRYKRIDGYIYDLLKSDYSSEKGIMSSGLLVEAVGRAWKKYKDDKKDVWSGKKSIACFRSNQPISIPKKNIDIRNDPEHGNVFSFAAFSQKNEITNREDIGRVRFTILACDGTQKSIINRVLGGVYGIGASQIVYEKKKWMLYLTYSGEIENRELDAGKVLGIDMGEVYAVYASSFGNKGVFKISGGEVTAYARRLEKRKNDMLDQSRYCGGGRIGHGTKTRVMPVYKQENKIAEFRSTINHRYSREIVDYAVKNGYGTIQMEDLSGIKEETGFPKKLRHWTYFDLQSKIETKAKSEGINVVKIAPKYTSQRCSKCGCIDAANRPDQETFRCVSCGYSRNADYNASQNISIPGIDKIIEEAVRVLKQETA